jgi:hypothetical protein
MTMTRLAIILFIVIAVADVIFNNGRIVDALWDQMTQFGHWLNDGLSTITHKITP